MEVLVGECNFCGRCCKSPKGDAHCENLKVQDDGTTRCGVWETRYHRMPIRMVYDDGSLAYESRCAFFADHLAATGKLVLPPECSYKLVKIS